LEFYSNHLIGGSRLRTQPPAADWLIIWHEGVFLVSAENDERFPKSKKTGDDGQKKYKKSVNFPTRRHIFARCDETIKYFGTNHC